MILVAVGVLLIVNYYLGTRLTGETAGAPAAETAIRKLAEDPSFIDQMTNAVGELPTGAVVTFTRPCSEISGWAAYKGARGGTIEVPAETQDSASERLYVCEKE